MCSECLLIPLQSWGARFQIAFSSGGRSVYPVSERAIPFPSSSSPSFSLFSGYLFSAANFTFCCSPKRQKLSVQRASDFSQPANPSSPPSLLLYTKF